jgi:hypothetical protein
MKLTELPRYVRALASIPETDAPVISCYVSLERGRRANVAFLRQRIAVLRDSLTLPEKEPFEYAWAQIEYYLANDLPRETRSVALFARGGVLSFLVPLELQAPLPTSISIDLVPNIYHLIELRDAYDRYMILISTEESDQIVEVHVDSVTKELWVERPALRLRVGRERTKLHYQRHRRDKTDQLVRETIAVLDKLMDGGGHSHLILAGRPDMTSRVKRGLPNRLVAKLADTVAAGTGAALPEVVALTLRSFIQFEEKESMSFARKLLSEVRIGGPAVVGTRETLQAVRRAQADVVIMSHSYDPDPGWSCAQCGFVNVEIRPSSCPECESRDLRVVDVKEEIVRLAEQSGCLVEIVNGVLRLGGVGALLRYHQPSDAAQADPEYSFNQQEFVPTVAAESVTC